jgi:hypothetical protein
MTEATQPRMARGTKVSAAILTAALFALLAVAPLANAAPDPVGSGSATVTLNKGFTKYLKTFGIKVLKVSPATLKGQKLTLPVTGGEVDPLTGGGTVNLGGGLKFKAGKKKAAVKAIVINTTSKSVTAKVAGKKMKFATVGGYSFVRNGFGVNMTIKKLKLTKKAAKQLNKKTGYAKGKPKPFIGGKLIGKATVEEQPATVTIVPGNNVEFNANNELLKKLNEVEVKVATIAPTTEKATGKYELPITGGSIAPTATAGVVQTGGGLNLTQKLPKSETEFLETEITLGNFYLDLSAHTVSVEVVAKSNASEKLNLGALGRSSIADLTLTGATVTADPTAHTVTVKDASATLQPISAEVLEGFVKVYEGWLTAVLQGPPFFLTEEEAKAKAAEETKDDHITAGLLLGTFSFTAQTQ